MPTLGLVEQARLADARLADEQQRADPASSSRLGKQAFDRGQLIRPPDELVAQRVRLPPHDRGAI